MNNLVSISPPINVETLNQILEQHSKYKKTRHSIQKKYRVTKIINVSLKPCYYVGKTVKTKQKTHLQIKFTSPDESGLICMSIPIDKYLEIIHHIISPITITNNYIL